MRALDLRLPSSRRTDVMARRMQRVHAARGGTVCHASGVGEPMPSYWSLKAAERRDDYPGVLFPRAR